jgi:hypothetical protein
LVLVMVVDVGADGRACRSGNVCGRTAQQVDGRVKATLDEHQPPWYRSFVDRLQRRPWASVPLTVSELCAGLDF